MARQLDIVRRRLITAMGASTLIPFIPPLSHAKAGPGRTSTFALGDVTLGDGIFAHSHAVNLRYLAALDVDRLLAPMRIEAGLDPRAEKYPNWESMGLDGHTAGHYLSALAQEAAQGHSGMRQRLETMVAGMAEVQRAYGDGYVGGVPDGRELWREVAAGKFDATGFSINGRWVPFYNLHKTFAGLRDAWLLAGSARAREVLVGFADWADRLVADLDEEQMQRLLETEHGGMNEVLADTYAITGERRYLRLARRFSHRAILDPLLRREDALDGLHANTQIPKVIGFARIGELDHDREWMDAAAFFWGRVAQHRSIAFGGNSVREHFNPLDDFSAMTISPEGPETCNSYNMLRLTLLLHRLDPQAGHADFYERVLFNHILSSQHPEHGGLVYFTPIRARHYRVYSQPQECFWCCVGSGIENHGRHTAFTYARHDGALAVNLYMASQLHWRERGLTLTQDTAFPYQPASTLRLSMERPQPFTLKLRHPHWLEGPLSVRINGDSWPLESAPGAYVAIARTWSDGDRVEIELPMRTRIEDLPDGSDQVAVMHGPVLLAARTGTEDLDGLIADDGRGSHIAPGPHMPLDRAPMLVGDRERLADGIVAVAGEPLVFSAEALIRPQGFRSLRLEPFHRVHDSRYMAYWRTTTAAAYPALLARIEADERERRAIEQRTLDRIQPGEQQPEVEHAFQGKDSRSGLHFGRRWRDTGKWMSYRLTAPAGTPRDTGMMLALTFYGGDWNEGFELHVNGQLLETIALSGDAKDRFVDHVVALPVPVAAGAAEGITLKLSAAQGRRTARLFDVRLLRA